MIKVSIKNMRKIRKGIRRADVVICPDSALVACIGLECWRLGVPSIWVMHTNFMAIGKHVLADILFRFYDMASTFFLSSYGSAFTHILTTSQDYMQVLRQKGFRVSAYIDQGFKAEVFKEHDSDQDIAQLRQSLIDGTYHSPDSTPASASVATKRAGTNTNNSSNNNSSSSNTSNVKLLLFAGRFSPEKRIELLFDCIPEGFKLVLVGDGALKERFLAKQKQDPRIVVVAQMLGQDQLRRFYKAADITVSASDFETFGMTVHESLLCGTPVVVQDGSGFRSQVRHGINGFLTNYEDPPVAKRAIVAAATHAFDPRPFRPGDCVDLVEFVKNTAKQPVAPVSTFMSIVITLLQMLYFVPTRISQELFHEPEPKDQ